MPKKQGNFDSQYITDEDIEKVKQFVVQGDYKAILKLVDAYIDGIYVDQPNCDDCEDRIGEPQHNEGYD